MGQLNRYPQPRSFNGFNIRFATTQEEREEAYRLRYRVFAQELGRRKHMDATRLQMRDEVDDCGSHIVIAVGDSEVVATLRFTLRSESAFLVEDEILFQAFLSAEDPYATALADRGAIAPACRGRGLYPVLWDYGFDFCRSRGISAIVGAIDANHKALIDFHAKRRWTNLREAVTDDQGTWNAIVLRL